jgi:multiple sugar transport system permease protein
VANTTIPGIKPLGKEKLWLGLLLTPTVIGLIFGVLGSIVATIGLSFVQWDLIQPPTWVGFQNFIDLFTNAKFIKAMTTTVAFAGLYVPGVVVISLLVALLMNRKIKGISIFRTIYFLPGVTSAVATAIVWNMIYGRDTGVLNYIIELFGGQPVCWLCNENVLIAVVIVNIWGAIGEGMIIFLAGLQSVPRSFYEAATVDGAGEVQKFLHITIPLITPALFFQTLITTINAFQAYEYVYMLTRRAGGESSVPVVVYSIYRNAFNYFNYGGASAQAIELAVVVIILMSLYFWFERRFVVYD